MTHLKERSRLPMLLKLVVAIVIGTITVSTGAAVAATPTSSQPCTAQALWADMSGACVSELQQALEDAGYSVGPSGVDGHFGDDTESAVISLQEDNFLMVDGVVGPQSWSHLAHSDQPASERLSHLDDRCFSGGKWACVDKSDNRTYVLKNGDLIREMPSRTGGWFEFEGEWIQGHTPNGQFPVLWKVIDETSDLYDDSPMPHSQYFTNYGHAFHGSESLEADGWFTTPHGQGGSGGCINLYLGDAEWLWGYFGYGDAVWVQD